MMKSPPMHTLQHSIHNTRNTTLPALLAASLLGCCFSLRSNATPEAGPEPAASHIPKEVKKTQQPPIQFRSLEVKRAILHLAKFEGTLSGTRPDLVVEGRKLPLRQSLHAAERVIEKHTKNRDPVLPEEIDADVAALLLHMQACRVFVQGWETLNVQYLNSQPSEDHSRMKEILDVYERIFCLVLFHIRPVKGNEGLIEATGRFALALGTDFERDPERREKFFTLLEKAWGKPLQEYKSRESRLKQEKVPDVAGQ